MGRLPKAEGIAVARLSGVALRHAAGQGDRDPAGVDGPTAELHAISTDPRLLGIAAARHTVNPTALDRRAAQLLRDAGADEQMIAEHAEQVRYWRGLPTSQDQPRQPPDSSSGGGPGSVG